jgi:hypothetical protein
MQTFLVSSKYSRSMKTQEETEQERKEKSDKIKQAK